jgi:hypothetical protein
MGLRGVAVGLSEATGPEASLGLSEATGPEASPWD